MANVKFDSNSRVSLSNADNGANNTVFGKLAGNLLASGDTHNVFIGENVADADMTNAVENTAVGYSALSSLTEGDENTMIGRLAGRDVTTGSGNTMIGSAAGYQVDGGVAQCVVIGRGALNAQATTAANGTVTIGYGSLAALTSGPQNTIIGHSAADAMETGGYNVAMGVDALGASVDVDQAVAIGHSAMGGGNVTSAADGSVAVGKDALVSLTSGARNTALGYQVLDALPDGSDNTGVGYNALGASNHADSDHNTAVGVNAGDVITNGYQNTLIGSGTDPSAAGGIRQIVIGYGVTGQGNNSATIGDANMTALYAGSDSGAVVYAAGVNFPDDATAGVADVNTLDAYEEGTFSPTMIQSGSSSISYTTQSGHYTKIGRNVTVQLELNVNSYTSGGTGNTITVGGFPFSNATARGTGSVSPTAGHTFDDGSDASVMTFELIGTTAYMSETTTGGRSDWGGNNLSTSGWRIFAGVTYHAAT